MFSCRWQQLVLSDSFHPAPPADVCRLAPLLCSLPDLLYGQDRAGQPAAGEIKEWSTYRLHIISSLLKGPQEKLDKAKMLLGTPL